MALSSWGAFIDAVAVLLFSSIITGAAATSGRRRSKQTSERASERPLAVEAASDLCRSRLSLSQDKLKQARRLIAVVALQLFLEATGVCENF